jgi:hypothetical protein
MAASHCRLLLQSSLVSTDSAGIQGGHTLGAMDIKLKLPEVIAAGVLLPGTLLGSALASEPPTAVNSTDLVPADANVPLTASPSPDDTRVTRQIRDALHADSDLPRDVNNLVNVATNGQAVVLRGALRNTSQIARVETLAQNYAGARQVINELTVIDY